jgi:hypothetical protein
MAWRAKGDTVLPFADRERQWDGGAALDRAFRRGVRHETERTDDF